MKLKFKFLLFSPFLPCVFNKEEWGKDLKKFKDTLSSNEPKSSGQEVKNQLILRYDGLGFFKSNQPVTFRFSRAAMEALLLAEQNKNLEREKLLKLIGDTFDISTIQVDSFFRKLQKYIGKADIEFCEKPSSLKDLKTNLPLSVQWEITGACNLHCAHCYAEATESPKPNELSLTEIFDLIDTFSDYGIQSIHLLGGEPFMKEKILRIIERIVNSGMYCHISTNGTLITKNIAEKLGSFENLTVDVSLDGVCPNAHDSFRGVPGTFNKVMNSLRLLSESNININVTSVLGRHNISEVEELIQIAVENNAKRIQFLTFSTTGRGGQVQQELGFKSKSIPEIRKRLIDLILTNLDKIYIDAPFLGLSPLIFRLFEILNYPSFGNYYELLLGCNAGLTKMSISPTGSVMLCPQVRRTFGNLRKIDFLKVWRIINKYAKNNLRCSDTECEFLEYCGGKCRISNSFIGRESTDL